MSSSWASWTLNRADGRSGDGAAMTNRWITGLLLAVAGIHLLPLGGLFGAEQLTALYEIRVPDPNLGILMRHRAMLLAIVGGLLAYAAFSPGSQPIALIAAFSSLLSFLYLCFSIDGLNSAIRRVAMVDVFALLALLAATVLSFRRGQTS